MRAAWRPVGNYRVRLFPPPSRSHRPPLLSQGHCRGVVLPCCGSYQRPTSNNSFTVWRKSLCKLQNQMKLHYLFFMWTMKNGDLFLTVMALFQMYYCLSWVSWVNTLIRFRYIAYIILKFTKHQKSIVQNLWLICSVLIAVRLRFVLYRVTLRTLTNCKIQ